MKERTRLEDTLHVMSGTNDIKQERKGNIKNKKKILKNKMLRYHLNLLTFRWSQDIPKLQSVSQIKITLCVFLTSQLLLGFFFSFKY